MKRLILLLTVLLTACGPVDAGPLALIEGDYADVDVVALRDGGFRLYFGVEPEGDGHQFEIYTADSENLLNWEFEEEPVLNWATFPDAVELENGLRLYFQRHAEIWSADSVDGVTFELAEQASVQVPEGFDNVAAPSVVALEQGYLMVYRQAEMEAYSNESLNPVSMEFWLAYSEDGLSFVPLKQVVEGRNSVFMGYVDGPELTWEPDGRLALRFWTSAGRQNQEEAGQYVMYSENEGLSWMEPVLFSSEVGGDPTYLWQGKSLYSFYANRTGAIYSKQVR